MQSHLNIYLYILFTYIVSVLFRMPLFYEVLHIDFLWNGVIPVPIYTPDAGLHGFYAKEILAGIDLPYTSEYMLGHVIAGSVSLFRLPIDQVMLFLPIFVAPLAVIPIVLFAKELGNTLLGVIAALISMSFFNFYIRTSLGYTDTDMFILLFMFFALYYILRSIRSGDLKYAALTSLTILAFKHFYHSSSSIILGLLLIYLLFALFMNRKDPKVYQAIILMSIPMVISNFLYAAGAILVVYMLCRRFKGVLEIPVRYYLMFFVAAIIVGVFFIDLSPFYKRAIDYVDKYEQIIVNGRFGVYYFLHPLATVGETKVYGFAKNVFQFNLYSILGILSFIGYLLLVKKEKYYLLLAIFVLLGSMTYVAGFRFSFYYAPVYGFGLAYIIVYVAEFFKSRFGVQRLALYFTVLVLFFATYRIVTTDSYRYTRMLSYNQEAKVFNSLSAQLSPDDKIVSWWDYGWPLWYFTGKKNTIADNGAHGGPDTYLISRILRESNQTFVANAAKLLANHKDISEKNGYSYVLPYLADQQNLPKLFSSLYTRTDIIPEQGTYILLHRSMITIFSTIVKFSNFDIQDSNLTVKERYVYKSMRYQYSDDLNQSYFDRHNKVDINGEKVVVNRFTLVKGQQIEKEYLYDQNSTQYIILDNNDMAYILDDKTYNSFLFQALLMDNYDHELFEKVYETYLIKIFKVK